MKILVTGGVGFVGCNLVKRLLKEGHEVVVIDNYDSGTEDNEFLGAKYYKQDIRYLDRYRGDEYDGFDLCYHLAALSRIQPSFKNPVNTYDNNVNGTMQVAELARRNNAKVVYAGSSSRWHDPYRSPYATTKHMGEQIFRMYRKAYGMNAQIARFYNVYGPREIVRGDWAALIGIWRRQIEDGEKLTIVGDGEQRRDFTHVDDIVDALYRIGLSEEKHEDAWELGTGTNYSINELYQIFKEHFPEIDCIYLPDQPGNYRKTLRENDDALFRLGWKPKDRIWSYVKTLKNYS